MVRRLQPTLADYLVIAITPAIIMLLVGSLVFFLVEVFYQGNWDGRLRFVLACFVLATVLISRISMEQGVEYASLFGLPLAILTGVAMLRFVQIRGPLADVGWLINWSLLAIIWWSASKLTWDCTAIDESEEASGEGLLQTAGLTEHRGSGDPSQSQATAEPDASATTSGAAQDLSWWERWVEHRKRPHAPGVWVVYFSLAALPLFGVGQLLIPASNLASRRTAFGLLLVYVASGLALLVTTSFLGLRRYLRQRYLEMPPTMAATWIVVGGAFIVAVLLLAALIPRPNAEYAISQFPVSFGSPDQQGTSPQAVSGDGEKESPQGQQPDQKAQQGAAPADQSNRKPGAANSENATSKGQGEKTTQDPGEPSDRPAQQPDSAPEPAADPAVDPAEPSQSTARQPPPSEHADAQTNPPPPDQQAAPPVVQLPNFATDWLSALKWLVYAILIIGAGILAWKRRAELAAAWRKLLAELAAFWQRLFGRTASAENDAQDALAASPTQRFADFADPFLTGWARRASPDQLVRYTFQALEAWGREHGSPREPEQTPHEFAASLALRHPSLGREVRSLAELYSRLAYAGGSLPASVQPGLESLWSQLRTTAPASPEFLAR